MSPVSSSTPITLERIDDIFDGPIRRVQTFPLYWIGLLLTSVAMVLLPVIYMALIGLVLYGAYYHAVEHFAWFQEVQGMRGKLFLYAAPFVAGPTLVLFMIKPLFARSARLDKRVSFVRENEPVLFAFVEQLCETVHAPKPRRIDIDCDINASASFRRGALSLFTNDLVLTIGIPLVAGLNLREFAGILAHEFGHFSQPAAMRLSYIIRSVNAWFARVVYDRDTWDEKLREYSENENSRFAPLFLLARACVWLTRKVLWVLMLIGHGISCAMMRQMEFDADKHEARLAGSEAFESTARRLSLLQFVSQQVHAELAQSWKDGRLADDFPALLAARVETAPQPLVDALNKTIDASKTALFDTHPCDGARIRKAHKAKADGCVRVDAPASALFRHFERTSKSITISYYHDLLGPRFRRECLISTDEITRRSKELYRFGAAAERFFGGCLAATRPIRVDLSSEAAKSPPKQRVLKLKQARQAVLKHLEFMQRAHARYAKAEERVIETELAQTFVKIGVDINPRDFHLTTAKSDEILKAKQKAEQLKEQLASELKFVDVVVRLRIECALALLGVDQISARIDEAALMTRRTIELTEALAALSQDMSFLGDLRRRLPRLRALALLLADGDAEPSVLTCSQQLVREQHEELRNVRATLDHRAYPYKHASGQRSMGQFALKELPPSDDSIRVIAATEDMLDNLDSFYTRAMGELATFAERVEAVLGLRPLGTKKRQHQPSDESKAS